MYVYVCIYMRVNEERCMDIDGWGFGGSYLMCVLLIYYTMCRLASCEWTFLSHHTLSQC